MSLNFNHLVVITSSQCLIYRSNNWTTPVTIELRCPVVLIIQAANCFALVDRVGKLTAYNYDSRLLCSPKIPGAVAASFTAATVTLTNDTLIVRDPK